MLLFQLEEKLFQEKTNDKEGDVVGARLRDKKAVNCSRGGSPSFQSVGIRRSPRLRPAAKSGKKGAGCKKKLMKKKVYAQLGEVRKAIKGKRRGGGLK